MYPWMFLGIWGAMEFGVGIEGAGRLRDSLFGVLGALVQEG
jgi:hypothetical protein